ncbi:MAG: hypothetical protein Q4D16_15495 [Eubacteriales bacterium]|nr:hypothetical protein [Eubacteriales bacterium]
MLISRIRNSHKNDGYVIIVELGDYPKRIFHCKSKNDIVIRLKRIQLLQYRLRCLAREFKNIREWFPEQESASAEKMIHFLFQYDKVNIEETVRDLLNVAKSGDWDRFYSRYFSQLEWLGSASREETERQLEQLYFTKHYKKAIQDLTKKRNLEAVIFLRLLMETGIRPRDVYQMDSSCI